MNVKILKLTTGEEVVAEIVSETADTTVVKNTIAVVLAPSPDGQNIGFRFIPWGSVAEGDITIKNSSIIYSSDVKDELKNNYSSMFSGIVTPQKQLIV